MRSLFAPGATLKAIGPKGLHGGSLEDYISRNKDILEKEGFTERELGRRTEVWGGLATAWSAYDGRTANGSFHERGINSFQLVKIDGKWVVASILWQEETPDQLRFPAKLHSRNKEMSTQTLTKGWDPRSDGCSAPRRSFATAIMSISGSAFRRWSRTMCRRA